MLTAWHGHLLVVVLSGTDRHDRCAIKAYTSSHTTSRGQREQDAGAHEVLWKDDPAVLTRSGEFVSTDFRYFEPHLNRAQLHLSGAGPSSFRQARDYLRSGVIQGATRV